MADTTFALSDIRAKYERGGKLVMVTAYDAPSAALAVAAGVDMLLVGDSLATTVLGYETTLQATMEAMLLHTRAVAQAAGDKLVIGDMPFLSFQVSPAEAVRNAGRFLQEGRAGAVKVEGAAHLEALRAILAAGIPVMGHLGYTPQRALQFGKQIVQGKDLHAAALLVEQARTLQEAGCFALVLECVPREVAKVITEELEIPTIGIGAGPDCSGQVLVWHDLLGLLPGRRFKHNKVYAEVGEIIEQALETYASEVRSGAFPGDEQSFHAASELYEALKRNVGGK